MGIIEIAIQFIYMFIHAFVGAFLGVLLLVAFFVWCLKLIQKASRTKELVDG
jgi:hypothetical protein